MANITDDLVHDAEVIIAHASWLYLEEQALARLAGRRGLAWTPLFPRSRIIQVVAFDGAHLGRVRRIRPIPAQRSARWVATPKDGVPLGHFRTVRAAARALRHCR
jgi:hypothetical protein